MKTLHENNRNPKEGFSFEELSKLLFEDYGKVSRYALVHCGNNTFARWGLNPNGQPNISEVVIRYHDTDIAVLYGDGDSVWLKKIPHVLWTQSTQKRQDWCIRPLGYRVKRVRKVRKLYSIDTGEYRDLLLPMMVTRGSF